LIATLCPMPLLLPVTTITLPDSFFVAMDESLSEN
jgi:hypothetical protein